MTGWSMELGAQVLPTGGVRFRAWAPRARELAVRIVGRDRAVPMERGPGDLFEAVVHDLRPGVDYFFAIDRERDRPDPRSRWQPQGVHGPSRVLDPGAFTWNDEGWSGLDLEDLVLYELHVGAFTPEGTFDAAAARLADLRALGIRAVQLMPVAEFPGERGWGYDGVHLYAPHSAYGGPLGLKRFVDACHRAGMAVLLDVVYNHLGPEGCYLAEYGPYFTDRHRTPWGEALNYDGPDSDEVRRHIVDNALYWLTEYHVDGLRLDAVHGIHDQSARHLLAELSEAFHDEARRLGRKAWLVAESDLNDPRVVSPRELGGLGLDAQWNTDFHHALHARLTGARTGYFADFGHAADLAKAAAEGFVYDGQRSPWRRRRHGASSRAVPGKALVAFAQTHDEVANASGGARLSMLVSLEQQKLASALVVCAPSLPLFFMGQEYGELSPFHYFTHFLDENLARAVRAGREKEHQSFGHQAPFPDPQAEETFLACKLDWSLREKAPHAQLLAFHRDLLALRRALPALADCRKDLCRAESSEHPSWLLLERGSAGGGIVLVLANLGGAPCEIPVAAHGRYALALWTGDPRYAGPAGAAAPPRKIHGPGAALLAPWTAAVYASA